MKKRKIPLVDLIPICWDKVMKELHTIRQEQAAHFLAHERIGEQLEALSAGKQKV